MRKKNNKAKVSTVDIKNVPEAEELDDNKEKVEIEMMESTCDATVLEENALLEKCQKLWSCVDNFKFSTDPLVKLNALKELRSLAISKHGLCKNELRKECWPILLNMKALVDTERQKHDLPVIEGSMRENEGWKCYIKDYPDRKQVEVDVHRSLYSYTVCMKEWTDEQR